MKAAFARRVDDGWAVRFVPRDDALPDVDVLLEHGALGSLISSAGGQRAQRTVEDVKRARFMLDEAEALLCELLGGGTTLHGVREILLSRMEERREDDRAAEARRLRQIEREGRAA